MENKLPPNFNCAMILLAAGGSRRMQRSKPLLPWGNSTLLEHVLKINCSSSARRVFLVLGFEYEKILRQIPNLADALIEKCGNFRAEDRLRVVINRDWNQGMASSIKVGVKAAIESVSQERQASPFDCLALSLADLPLLSTDIINQVLKESERVAAEAEDRPYIVAPRWHGRNGHPVVFSSHFYPELVELEGDRGASPILKRHSDVIRYWDAPGPEIFTDCDNWEEYERCLKSAL